MERSGGFSGALRRHVLGVVAIYIAIGGTAIALPGRDSVNSNDVRDGAITNPKLADGAVDSRVVENRSLTGKDLRTSTLNFGQVQRRVRKRCEDGEAIRAVFADGTVGCEELSAGAQGPPGPRGETGPAGERGPEGPPGPSTGAAGGDLTGNYPNPEIAAGAVDSSKVENGSLTGDDIDASTFPFWSLQGNAGTTAGTDFLGTTDDEPLELRVNSTRALRIEPTAFAPNLVGGAASNQTAAGVDGAVIGGGSSNSASSDATTISGGIRNVASSLAATVGGGRDNSATGDDAVVAGGNQNRATSFGASAGGGEANLASGARSVAAGGFANAASGFASVVSGGSGNAATGTSATVAGGSGNAATGIESSVVGGDANVAAGRGSVVGGHLANNEAAHNGTFLFADRTGAPFSSLAANEFAARATGGFRFVTAVVPGTGAPTAGCTIDQPGDMTCSGMFFAGSDRDAKTDFAAVDERGILNKLSGLPISTWRFKTEESGTRHLGPTAQDFADAFGIGADRKHIGTVDADGVALAAIKGLNEVVREQGEEIASLRAEIEAMKGG